MVLYGRRLGPPIAKQGIVNECFRIDLLHI